MKALRRSAGREGECRHRRTLLAAAIGISVGFTRVDSATARNQLGRMVVIQRLIGRW